MAFDIPVSKELLFRYFISGSIYGSLCKFNLLTTIYLARRIIPTPSVYINIFISVATTVRLDDGSYRLVTSCIAIKNVFRIFN